jgi:hypothetical protein
MYLYLRDSEVVPNFCKALVSGLFTRCKSQAPLSILFYFIFPMICNGGEKKGHWAL